MKKKYIRKGLILFVGYLIICDGLDAIFREIKPLEKMIQGLLFTAFILLHDYYFDDKG